MTPGPARRLRRWVAGAAALLGLVALAGGPRAGAQEDAPRVLVSRVADAITPVVSDHLRDGVARAERDGYDAFVVELDTPGGLDTSMREIVQRFLGAEVPVIVYVSPRGARAASAGAVITFAAHVAAMAPGTNIGAATPVSLEGGEVSGKVVNDAAAYVEAVAEVRGRNPDFAVDTVRDGRSAGVEEAVEIGAVDLEARSLAELLELVDGDPVELASGAVERLRTAGAAVDRYELGLFREILQFLADPNVIFLLLSLGTLGLIYELATPGVGFGGVTGVILLVLALFGLSVLPVRAVGVVFLVLAAALFVAEVVAPGFAGFAAGGAALLVVSALFLFEETPGLSVSLAMVLPVAIVVGGAVVVAGRLALRSRRAPPSSGSDALRGRVAVVRRDDRAGAQVFLDGAWWKVRAEGAAGEPEDGRRIRVVGVDGLVLLVEPAPDEATAAGTPPPSRDHGGAHE